MKDKIFLIASLLAIVAGALMGLVNIFLQDDSPMFAIMGFVLVFFGIIALITGYTTPSVAQSKEGVTVSYLMIIASILVLIGSLDPLALWPLLLIGGGLLLLSVFCLWPCFCCQGKSKNKDKVIGVASAHDSITVHELSERTGLSTSVVRDLLYDAIGKGELAGKMDANTFIRGRPITTTYAGHTTHEREIVKVLVICPYCGAKTEQGLAKCQNCQADL
ncbi:MAG: hypothetical protein P1Q69_06370 [Candidatus Thorarchaeota archaeon]|nr:hypothetical protein [Candidatus Thorarchaeota archaeon]